MDINSFRKRFKSLTLSEQDILKVLAITYEPVHRDKLLDVLKDSEVLNANGNVMRTQDLDNFIELLESGDWVKVYFNKNIVVNKRLLELVMRMAVVDERYKYYIRVIRDHLPYREWGRYPRCFEVCVRELRIALYEGSMDRLTEIINELFRYYQDEWLELDFFTNFFEPFDPDWINTFPVPIQQLALTQSLAKRTADLEPIKDFSDFLHDNGWTKNKEKLSTGISMMFQLKLLQGKFREADELLEKEVLSAEKLSRKGTVAFFLGDHKLALDAFEGGVKMLKKDNGQKNAAYTGLEGAIHVLSILKDRSSNYLQRARKMCIESDTQTTDNLYIYLNAAILFQLNYIEAADEQLENKPGTPLEFIFYAAATYWNDGELQHEELVELHRLFQRANENDYRWLAMEFAILISLFEEDEMTAQRYGIIASQMEEEMGVNSIVRVVPRSEKWQRSLDALLQLKPRKSKKYNRKEKETRLVWLVDFVNREIQPVEQTLGQGGWSKGRNVALKRLKDGSLKNMTDQDKEVARAVQAQNKGYYANTDFYINFEEAVTALVGHPLMFLQENRQVSVELVRQRPQLLVEENNGHYLLRFSHEFEEAGVAVIRETPTRFIALTVDEVHLNIQRLLDYDTLQIPSTAKDKLIEVVGNLSTLVTVQSAIGGEAVEVETIEGNPIPHLHLLPVGDGFKIEFFVKPFTTDAPYFKPGAGRETVIAEVNGVPARAHRKLKLEKDMARRVEDACPTLQRMPSHNLEWLFENVEDCLTVLLELEALRAAGEVVLEHPKGEKLRIAGQVSFDQLSLGIKKERDWFEVEGKVQVNEDLVMDFRELLEISRNTDSRFVEVSDGQFLALTSQLRRKLDDLNAIFSHTQNDIRFHPLAAPMLEDFTSLLHDLETDAAWQNQLNRLQEARELNPKVPSTFKAELRDYQKDGFRWLSQLAYWGVGACLADDMGLGKTVQALAVILDRAKAGPALVVAPASVVRNWFHEAKRFAPTLRPLIFGEGDRKEMIDDLQPFDLLLCSYGLMQQESRQFLDIHFTTIVLDEAQAIKNRSTKRSQTAMQLQADFKVITTGTPIENHLGELWTLFNFLNPGLLGSLKHFNDTYAVPIERFQDRERRNQLKRLIQPFILRRRKNDVLDELPEKTEVTLTVELSPEERAFYEALRRRALANIASGNGEAGNQRFKILAELMRLRQACCHPRMVDPKSPLDSSKLSLLSETVEELLEEGHKALIFSQFVKHLRIVEEWVKEQGISYQYLDGSTPVIQRDKAIRAFQAGEGDLFLISLKAGGFGLNLTAADYVIHLDPWWNPAVEDQASDRAHRIGQQRPVTIYRLVAENTIEEKIVKLHADKRDLADSLLEGTERAGKLSAEDLLALMKG